MYIYLIASGVIWTMDLADRVYRFMCPVSVAIQRDHPNVLAVWSPRTKEAPDLGFPITIAEDFPN
jgi:hypothetical protein